MAPHRHASRLGGFTLIELLTVIAMMSILATLLLSAISAAQKKSRQTVCLGNLRQITLATELYLDEFGKRPRSLSSLARKPAILPNSRTLLCPQDPIQRGTAGRPGKTNDAWGNLVNHSQQPSQFAVNKDIEEPSWEQELIVTQESRPFSYLHPLFWVKPAWRHLLQISRTLTGISVCELHGVRISDPARLAIVERQPFLAWEGLTLRAQQDGAVVLRRLFHGNETGGGSPLIPIRINDYPWEYYSDQWTPLVN